jgi:YD repeat-containing protein
MTMSIRLLCAALLLIPAIALAEVENENAYIDPLTVENTVPPVKSQASCDSSGRVSHIDRADGGFADYFYHPTLNKISAVVTDQVSTVFSYDKVGNLIRAYNTHGQLIVLGYDSHKRINHMVETIQGERRELTFKYNAQGKPVVIRLLGKGEIKVEYDAQGEITKVESKQGTKMALGVTQAFQMLLQVVKVAGAEM